MVAISQLFYDRIPFSENVKYALILRSISLLMEHLLNHSMLYHPNFIFRLS